MRGTGLKHSNIPRTYMFKGQDVKKKVYLFVSLHTCDSASRSKNSPVDTTMSSVASRWVERDELAYGHSPQPCDAEQSVFDVVWFRRGFVSLTQGWSGRRGNVSTT